MHNIHVSTVPTQTLPIVECTYYNSKYRSRGNLSTLFFEDISICKKLLCQHHFNSKLFRRTGHIFARQTRDATRPINGYSLVLNEGSQIYQERTGNNHVATSVVAIPLNEYSHVVGVYDGAAMLIYIDGLLRVSTPTTDPMRDFNARVLIGCSIPDQWCFDGDIDEVAVYDRALLDVTIAAHFAAR
jgi:hypothetical protein